MTAEEKTSLASFFHITENFLRSGFAEERAAYTFEDDQAPEAGSLESGGEAAEPHLPLAYLVDEEAEEGLPAMVMGPSLTEQETQLLERMLASIGLYRNRNCHISDLVEDRPALERQMERLNPRVILCVGQDACNSVAYNSVSGSASITGSLPPVLKTFHPAEILRDESLRRPAFDDMKRLMTVLAEIDNNYRNKVKELIKKYAAADPEFASRISSYVRELG
jgi:DNA polymerase